MSAELLDETPRPLLPDARPLRDVTVDALNLDLVAAHVDRARSRGRYAGGPDLMTYLRDRQCVAEHEGTLHATLAGLLCFGQRPQDWLPQAIVDLGHYRGKRQISSEVIHLEKHIGGTLFDQLTRVESYLWGTIRHGMTLASDRSVLPGNGSSEGRADGFERQDLHEYPLIVIRELCANMLAHRDYRQQVFSACRVMLYRDRIEWASPGGLPLGVTVQNLLTAQASRNPTILGVFYDAGFVEAFGQGLDTVVAVLEEEEMEPPIFRDTGESFLVTVFGRAGQAAADDEQLYGKLTETQRRIVTFLRRKEYAGPQDIQGFLGTARSKRSIQRDLSVLVDAQIIEAVGGSRAIRYRLRDDG